MGLMRKIMLVLGFGLVAASATASVGNPELGKEYTMLERPQPTESGKKSK